MIQAFVVILLIAIRLFPVVRPFLPQREEDWLFELSTRHKRISRVIAKVLEEHNPYYRALSYEGKEKFIRRILFIIFKKTLVGYHDMKLTLNEAILIMAAQVQLTFGLKKFSLPHFEKIIVYPRQFYSRYFEQDVKGLTSARGFITLSWVDSLEGIKDPNDNLNLLLHEYAHALMLNLEWSNLNDNQFKRSFEEFAEISQDVFEDIDKGRPGKHEYLRSYGFTNKNEFFAVCVEHFFETPEQFQQKLSELYSYFCKLLNQNPLNTHKDYRLNEESV